MTTLLRLSPRQQFAILSLVVFVLLAVALATILGQRIQGQITRNAVDAIGQAVRTVVRPQLSSSDLERPMTGERYASFDAFMREYVLSDSVARVKVWNRSGVIVYANDPDLVGLAFAVEDDLRQTLETGRVVVDLATLSKPENLGERGFGNLVEIYVPLTPRDSNEVAGAYEVYLVPERIFADARGALATVWSSVVVTFAALWVALYWVFARASASLARLEGARRQLTLLALLNEVTADTGGARSEEELVRRAADSVAQRFGYDLVAISLVDRSSGELVVRATARDVASDGRSVPGLGSRAELAVQLRHKDGILGVLNIESRRRHAFEQDHVVAMETLANHLAIALTSVRLLEETRALAVTDGLTGLANRRSLDEHLANEIRRARRYAHPLSLLMADIDHFKDFNDRHGHARGDEVLRLVAGCLAGGVRETDLAARYGGEEFVVLLPETPLPAAVEVTEKLQASLASAQARADGETAVTISVGVAALAGHGGDATPADHSVAGEAAALLAAVDAALYEAKRAGRNCIRS